MLLLTSTSDKLQVVTTTTANIDVHASYVDLASGVVSAGRLNTKITTATTTDVVASPAASTARNVKTLTVANVHASASNVVTIQHTDGTNVVQLESVTLLAGERIAYREGIGMRVIDAAGNEKVNAQVVAGSLIVASLATAATANATTTAAKITGLDTAVPAGKWIFEYFVIYQAAATTTGVKFSVNHTGTAAVFPYVAYGPSADTTASATQTALMDQDILTTTGGLFEVWAARAKSTAAALGPTSGVDTINSDLLHFIQGLAIVTVAGNMELYHASEVAASSQVMAGTCLRLTKVG